MEPRISDLAAEYVEMRSRRHELADNTRNLTRSVLGIFTRAIDNPPVSELTRHHVEKWLSRENVAPGTLRGRLSIVRTFCRWLVMSDYLTRDPTLGIKGPRQPRTLPRVLAPESVGATLEACPDARARLIIQLMVQEGLRAHEVVGLEYGDIDEVNRLVHVVGKYGAHRVLPLTDEAFRCLRRYLAEHPPIQGPLIRSYRHPNKGHRPALHLDVGVVVDARGRREEATEGRHLGARVEADGGDGGGGRVEGPASGAEPSWA